MLSQRVPRSRGGWPAISTSTAGAMWCTKTPGTSSRRRRTILIDRSRHHEHRRVIMNVAPDSFGEALSYVHLE